jgi:hypothetical protein
LTHKSWVPFKPLHHLRLTSILTNENNWNFDLVIGQLVKCDLVYSLSYILNWRI